MNTRKLLIAGGVLVAAFLLGFVPQYLKARDLEKQLDATRNELQGERAKRQFDELALLIGYVYLQANVKNYGLASQYSTKFFDGVRAVGSPASDSKRQGFLQSALAKRDGVTAGLAKGDPGIVAAVQELFQGALDAAETPGK